MSTSEVSGNDESDAIVDRWTFPITSKIDFEGLHELHAIVRDDEGRWDEAVTELRVELPPSGTPVWINEGQLGDYQLGVAVKAVEGGVLVIARNLDLGSKKSSVRRYDESGALEWEYESAAIVNDLVVKKDGEIVLVGASSFEGITRAWVRRLAADGTPIFEPPKTWLDNSKATAVAVADDGDLYIVGDLRIVDGNPEHTDVFVWHLPAEGAPYWTTWDSGVGLVPNDHAAAIVIDDDGRVFVGGSAILAVPNFDPAPRMSVLEYASGALSLRWGDRTEIESLSEARGLAVVDGDLAVAGWRRVTEDAPHLLVVKRVRENGEEPFTTVWTYAAGEDMRAVDIVSDLNGRLVVAATVSIGQDQLETLVLEPDGAFLWSANYQHPMGDASAAAVTADRYGYAYFVGTLAINDGYRVLVGKRHP
jgi:hypothetical protein